MGSLYTIAPASIQVHAIPNEAQQFEGTHPAGSDYNTHSRRNQRTPITVSAMRILQAIDNIGAEQVLVSLANLLTIMIILL